MTRLVIVGLGVCATLAIVGCSSDDTTGGGPCAQRKGTYLTTFKTRSGNCGDIPEQVDTITSQPTEPAAPCTGTIGYSADNCEVTNDIICPEDGLGAGWTSTIELKATWSESGDRGTAIQQVVIKNADGGIECQGSYDATVTRQ